MARSKKYKSFASKLGIGFDPILDIIETIDSKSDLDTFSQIPPFNIKKTTDIDYLFEISIPGVKKDDIIAYLDADKLSITAPVKKAADPDNDDVYLHRGIFSGGNWEVKLDVARNLQFKAAEYIDGILHVHFVDTNILRESKRLAIGPFPKPDVEYKVDYTHAGSPILVPVSEKTAEVVQMELTPEVVETVSEPTPTVGIEVNEDTKVVLPTEIPAIVEVEVTKDPDTEQTIIEVKDATYEVSDDVVLNVVKTEESRADIVVATSVEDNDVSEKVKEVIAQAIDNEVVFAPVLTPSVDAEIVEVQPVIIPTEDDETKLIVDVPETIPQVVELVEVVNEDKETTVEISLNEPVITDETVLIPVVTPGVEQNDIVVAIQPELNDKLQGVTENLVSDLETALEVADVTVVPVDEDVKVDDSASEASQETVETPVEVAVADTIGQIVEVIPTVEDGVVKIEVVDATHEIVSDVVNTEVIATEEGKSDIVVAVDTVQAEEIQASTGVNVIEEVKAAIEETAPVVVESPVIPEEVTTSLVIVETPEDAPNVDVVVPDAVASIVEVVVTDEGKVELQNVTETIPEGDLIPVVTPGGEDKHDIVAVVSKETSAKLEAVTEVPVESLVHDALAIAQPELVLPGAEASEEAKTHDSVTVETKTEDAPSVEVTVPAELPQIVEVVVDKVDVNPEVAAPDVEVHLEPATYEVSDNVTLEVVKTEEGKADLIVAIPDEVKAELENAGVENLVPAIQEAVGSNNVEDPVIVAPESEENKEVTVKEDETLESQVTVIVPNEITPVSVAEVVTSDDLGTQIKLVPVDENVPENVELLPVVTPGVEQNDIVVAVTPEVKEVLADENIQTVLETALEEATVTVIATEDSKIEEIVDKESNQ